MAGSIHFGPFALDLDTRQLLRNDRALHLTPKAFELLSLLVQDRPRVLSKQDLQDRLWPATFVSETSLTTLVGEMRGVLGDDPRKPQFIRTVYGYGYSFCGETTLDDRGAATSPAAVGPTCWLVADDRQLRLIEGENIVGRNALFGGLFDLGAVSRRHARIVIIGKAATLEDLGSKNGTYVAGEAVVGVRPLTDGDEIRFGRAHATFRVVESDIPTETALPSGVLNRPDPKN